MLKKGFSWFKELTTFGKAGVIIAGLIGFSAVGVAADNLSQNSIPIQPAAVQGEQTQNPDKVTHETVTETKAIPFETTEQSTSSLLKGDTKTLAEGVNGERVITYNVTYTNGIETARVKVSDKTTKEPITRIIAIGTYVAPAPQPSCPNGTYVNSAGNTVCSPYQSSSAPAGATAECRDGTYSFSQSRRGTCSHHGGVAEWL